MKPIEGAESVQAWWYGRLPYAEAWEIQRQLFAEVAAGSRENTFLLCEHPDVVTLGRNARNDETLRVPRAELQAMGYDLFDVDRGGDVTYHGPGQLVGYPIVRLGDFREDLGWFMRSLEELIIRGIRPWGVEGTRIDGLSGVWAEERKVCAIGIRASRWTTMHGFALNVTTDLARFDPIIPCGIDDHGVASIESLTGARPELLELAESVVREWDGVMMGKD